MASKQGGTWELHTTYAYLACVTGAHRAYCMGHHGLHACLFFTSTASMQQPGWQTRGGCHAEDVRAWRIHRKRRRIGCALDMQGTALRAPYKRRKIHAKAYTLLAVTAPAAAALPGSLRGPGPPGVRPAGRQHRRATAGQPAEVVGQRGCRRRPRRLARCSLTSKARLGRRRKTPAWGARLHPPAGA